MTHRYQGRRTGFTLVELMVVAIIVAVLASVAIPLMTANKRRAMSTEAESSLGTIRSALRTLQAETGSYNIKSDGTTLAGSGNCKDLPNVTSSDLDGKYWVNTCYTYSGLASNTYTLTATGISTGMTAGITITLDQGGNFTRTGL